MMRGIGGPLLCIGDLLSDVGQESTDVVDDGVEVGSSSFLDVNLQYSHLPQLFQVCLYMYIIHVCLRSKSLMFLQFMNML